MNWHTKRRENLQHGFRFYLCAFYFRKENSATLRFMYWIVSNSFSFHLFLHLSWQSKMCSIFPLSTHFIVSWVGLAYLCFRQLCGNQIECLWNFAKKKTFALANADVNMHNNNNSSSELLFITYCEMERKPRVFGMYKLNGFEFVAESKNLGVLLKDYTCSGDFTALKYICECQINYEWENTRWNCEKVTADRMLFKCNFICFSYLPCIRLIYWKFASSRCRWSLGNKKNAVICYSL